MGSGRILPIEFVGNSSVISEDRIGSDLVFSAHVEEFNPPSSASVSSRQYSRRHTRKATTVRGVFSRGAVVLDRLPGDRLPLLDELLESARDESEIVLDATHFSGIQRKLTVFITDTNYDRDRLERYDNYRFAFNYEALNDSGHMRDTGTYTQSDQSNTLKVLTEEKRFAHMYFDVPSAGQAVAFRLALVGTNLRVTCNGRRVIHHATGLRQYNITLNDVILPGANSIRVESLDALTDWSAFNARVII